MISRIKTGDCFQIRKNGPNYLALGKVRDKDGIDYIAATKNGNVTVDGKFKRTARGLPKPKIHVISGGAVKRVHGSRPVDLESVCKANGRLAKHLDKTTGRTGVVIDAPNVLAEVALLQASL